MPFSTGKRPKHNTSFQDAVGGLGAVGAGLTGAEPYLTPEGDVAMVGKRLPGEPVTIGGFQFFTPEGYADPDLRKHEARHSEQSRALGVKALPMMYKEGKGPYGSGPLERDAMHHVSPLGPETAPERPYSAAVEAYLKSILGE